MSGGQMQRVAIARALVNDPDILLADEPTGALDTQTSIQIMEILKEISQNRLIIMVTHNPDLAETYSTRIVKLLDGELTDDSNPYTEEQIQDDHKRKREDVKKDKKSMSFFTAMSLSFNNLMTKRTRTLLTSFAGSIGIIGIALILALSTGIQAYVDAVQEDTLSEYPLSITAKEDMISSLLNTTKDQMTKKKKHEDDAIYSDPMMFAMFNAMFSNTEDYNDLESFKEFIDKEMNEDTSTTDLYKYVSSIQYQYGVNINGYVKNSDGNYVPTTMSDALESFGNTDVAEGSNSESMYTMISAQAGQLNIWKELLNGKDDLVSPAEKDSYELVYGNWPTDKNEIVLFVDQYNEVPDLGFYALGMIDDQEIRDIIASVISGEELPVVERKLSYEEICNSEFKILLNSDYYSDKDGDGVFEYIGKDEKAMDLLVKNGYDLKITGIVRSNEQAGMNSQGQVFGYTHALTEYIIEQSAKSPVVMAQTSKANENTDILTGKPFVVDINENISDAEKAKKISEFFNSLDEKGKVDLYTKILSQPSQEYLDETLAGYMSQYDTRDKMIDLATQSYGMDEETIRSYLESYTDEEINELMKQQFTAIIMEQYAQAAKEQVAQIMNTPSEGELSLLVPQITAEINTTELKVGYVFNNWKSTTSMSETAITTYLMGLSPEELDKAVYSVASADAAKLYASMGDADAGNRYSKAAQVFDSQYANVTDEKTLVGYYDLYMPSGTSGSTLSENLETIGAFDVATPSAINIYSNSFENKDKISGIINDYNDKASEDQVINYTDYIALLMSGITDIINAISYGLIAFVSISLIVSSIMIGIITYISVLERTKEIGVLRSIGASKHDVSLVFNAETMIVGLTSGLMGVIISMLLCLPINFVIHKLTGIYEINAFLEPLHSVILVAISVGLTLIAGLIPSRLAAKKDPVEALRTE
ncbi:MAG: FtsX-like permease family protein [Clostridiales bacterium]|nr:FtsX-like permease family protein [Clostridiales bacterium]